LKDRAVACVKRSFAAVASVDLNGSFEAHNTAVAELLEAADLYAAADCSKEVLDVEKLTSSIVADKALRQAVDLFKTQVDASKKESAAPSHARAPNAPFAFAPEALPESHAPAPAPEAPPSPRLRASGSAALTPFAGIVSALAKSRSCLKAVAGLRATTLRGWIARGAELLDQVLKIESFLSSCAKFDPVTHTVAPMKNRRAPKPTPELVAQIHHHHNLAEQMNDLQAFKGTLVVPVTLLQDELHRLAHILDPFAADRPVKAPAT
jgi:hypothetical protein